MTPRFVSSHVRKLRRTLARPEHAQHRPNMRLPDHVRIVFVDQAVRADQLAARCRGLGHGNREIGGTPDIPLFIPNHIISNHLSLRFPQRAPTSPAQLVPCIRPRCERRKLPHSPPPNQPTPKGSLRLPAANDSERVLRLADELLGIQRLQLRTRQRPALVLIRPPGRQRQRHHHIVMARPRP